MCVEGVDVLVGYRAVATLPFVVGASVVGGGIRYVRGEVFVARSLHHR